MFNNRLRKNEIEAIVEKGQTMAVAENIRRDHNKASVILWSIANETPNNAARTAFLTSLADHVHELDPTRLVTAARRECENIADRSSRQDLVKNEDGSVDIFMGPTAPAGMKKNWIPTIPGKAWFAYFRLYAPEQAYFDKSWKLTDIEAVP